MNDVWVNITKEESYLIMNLTPKHVVWHVALVTYATPNEYFNLMLLNDYQKYFSKLSLLFYGDVYGP